MILWGLMYTPFYPTVVLHPDSKDSELYKLEKIQDAPREELFIDSHGDKMHAWLFRKPHSHILVIVHHGNAGNILNRVFLAKAFIQAGASVLLYDYRGFGKSSGKQSLNGIAEDGIVAFDYAKNNFKYPVLINYGESIGSGVACIVDSQRKADALVLQSGIESLPHVAKDGIMVFKLYPDNMWPQPQFDNGALLAQSHTPLLILHGEKDTMVPWKHSQHLFDVAAARDKAFIKLPKCGHNDVGFFDADLFQKSITDFVAQHPKQLDAK
jgi:hypothetical protein